MIKPHMSDEKYGVIGLMSGTSIDGLDIAFCRIVVKKNEWKHELINAETVPYPDYWKKRLLSLEKTDALSFQQTHVDYGYYIGQLVLAFIAKYNVKADFISSHGHTVFHQPEHKLTVQIGDGATIAATCKLPVVCDFRTLDVALGGQGAPLVPIGDKLLFSTYDYCLNLGGFANISFEQNNHRIAFDICPVNIVMNVYAEKLNFSFDTNGEFAKSGKINLQLFNELNQLSFYHQPVDTPKSLGKEWVVKNVFPLIEKFSESPENILCTYCEHIAFQISKVITNNSGTVLVTGGGAFNSFLIERIKFLTTASIVIPDNKTIEFKEALIFALLGVLKMRNEVNSLKSVTGACMDSSGGAVYVV